ncbi:uncharacterized protein BCR38DRAFT_483326 [Pseudomassariella vexata]|uniref:Tat pathway signal sequence n=1 Tax=Pseudomassariella vexata TaxID=1141098 RepID=A0A1Y2E824_9PEZI|nr:uncharacterized protein BCR38DRAFT_483326 [Pseudomassariella vexata]ORY67718.1 hypothetical protein BCR38DRAFT_483326 [Pseudomassariella vexata]
MPISDHEESDTLLEAASDSSFSAVKELKHPGSHRLRFTRWVFLCSITANVLLSLAVAKFLIYSSESCHDPLLQLYSPAQNAVEYVVSHPDDSIHGTNEWMNMLFDGSANGGVGERWKGLYTPYMDVAITQQEAAQLGEQSVMIPGTDQYIVELEVHHQLHCLDSLRRALFPTTPGQGHQQNNSFSAEVEEDENDDPGAHHPKHLDHCIDWIRQALMCWVDITPVSWAVDPATGLPEPQIPQQRTCRNWDLVQAWADGHRVSDDVLESFEGVL